MVKSVEHSIFKELGEDKKQERELLQRGGIRALIEELLWKKLEKDEKKN